MPIHTNVYTDMERDGGTTSQVVCEVYNKAEGMLYDPYFIESIEDGLLVCAMKHVSRLRSMGINKGAWSKDCVMYITARYKHRQLCMMNESLRPADEIKSSITVDVRFD